jgi:chromosome segregation ATPase
VARPGVTYLDVAKTAIKLVEQKVHPSIEEVRKALGAGSNSTINRHLREWHSKHPYQAEMEQGLPEPLLLAVKGIYEGIKEESINKINIIENGSKSALAELKTKLTELETEHNKFIQANKLLENTVNERQEEILALQRRLDVLEQALDKKATESNTLQDRLEDKKVEVDTLKQQLKNAQGNLDHYRETIRQTRETENNLLNGQIKNLENQLHQQQSTAEKVAEEITKLSKKVEALENGKEAVVQELNVSLAKSQEQTNIIQKQNLIHNEVSEKYKNILSDNNKITCKLKTEKETTAILKTSFGKAQERIAMLDDALKKAEAKIVSIGDKNLFLTQEKTELACQLKQLLPNKH